MEESMKSLFTIGLFKSALVVAVAILFGSAAMAQTGPTAAPTAPAAPKLQAELLKTIDASHAKAGDEVTAKTITPLNFAGTKFAPGAIVKGHVTEAASDHLSLVFDSITVKKNSTSVG